MPWERARYKEMSSWKTIETENDIEDLLRLYYGFHDACIVAASYRSETSIDHEGTIHYSNIDGHTMTLRFQSQMALRSLELRFIGVRQARLIVGNDHFPCDLMDATLSFVNGQSVRKSERLIEWTGCSAFDFKNLDTTAHDFADHHIIANNLRWRFLEEDNCSHN